MKETRFKQTEIGLIPEDWEVSKLGKKCLIYRGGSPRPIENYITNNADGINWIKIGDVESDSKYIIKTKEKIKQEGVIRSRAVYAGDLILSNSMSFGRPYILKINGCIHDGWLVIQEYIKNFDLDYLYYLLGSAYVFRQYTQMAAGSSVQNLNKDKVSSVIVSIPTKKEQNKIATVLTSIDNLLISLDKLIEKKRLIKQGAMQELLTGKKRLPGFAGEWVERQLGEILDYEQPIKYITNNTNYVDTGIPVLTAGKTFILGYVYENTNIYTNLPVIIFDDFTTDCKYVDFWFKVKSSAIKMLKEKEGYNIKLIFEYLKLLRYNTTEHKRQWINTFSKELVYIPSNIKEQNAISKVLSSMDKEIESLEGKKAKYEQIKLGMMQQLLTGKIRLI